MQHNQHRRRLPDPPPPRVRRHAKQNRQASDDREPDPELTEVACSAPDHAERLVVLLAAIRRAHWERTTLVAGVRVLRATRIRELNHASLAAAIEAILDDNLVVDDVRFAHDEPGGGL